MLIRLSLLAICLGCAPLAAVDIHDRTITGAESYTDTTINAWNLVVAPTGSLSTIVNAGGRIAIQSASGQTKIQLGGRWAIVVPNQPPVVAYVSGSRVSSTIRRLSVIGFDDGGTANLTYTWSKPSQVTWQTGNTGAQVLASFAQAGSYTFGVTATDQGGLTATATITLQVSQEATTLSVLPNVVTTSSQTQQFSTTTRDQFGYEVVPQPAVTWSMSSGAGSIDASGLYTAAGLGTSQVLAAVATNPFVWNVGAITVTQTGHIVLSPTQANVVVTESAQFTATLVDQFNRPMPSQPSFSYAFTSTSAGSVSAAGLFTAGPVAGGPYVLTASAASYPSATAAVTLVAPPMKYLTFSPYASLTTSPTNYEIGRGWFNTVNGQVEMVPDRINISRAKGNGRIVQYFSAGNTAVKTPYLTLTNRSSEPFSSEPLRVRLAYGYISGPANQLRFENDGTGGAQTFYLSEFRYEDGTINVQFYQNIYTQVSCFLPSIDQVGIPFAKGDLSFDNLGSLTFDVGSGDGRTSGSYPNYTFSVTPTNNQSYTNSVTTAQPWSGTTSLPGFIPNTNYLSHLIASNLNSGGQRFVISYDSTDWRGATATLTDSSGDITVLGLIFGDFTSQQIISN